MLQLAISVRRITGGSLRLGFGGCLVSCNLRHVLLIMLLHVVCSHVALSISPGCCCCLSPSLPFHRVMPFIGSPACLGFMTCSCICLPKKVFIWDVDQLPFVISFPFVAAYSLEKKRSKRRPFEPVLLIHPGRYPPVTIVPISRRHGNQ